jgi:hypothetical protein
MSTCVSLILRKLSIVICVKMFEAEHTSRLKRYENDKEVVHESEGRSESCRW